MIIGLTFNVAFVLLHISFEPDIMKLIICFGLSERLLNLEIRLLNWGVCLLKMAYESDIIILFRLLWQGSFSNLISRVVYSTSSRLTTPTIIRYANKCLKLLSCG